MLESMAWNIALFKLVNGAHNGVMDLLLGVVTGLGDGLVVALCCAVLCMYQLRLGVAATLAFIFSGLLAQLIKHTWDMPRPPALLDQVHLLGAALQSHSFPSGHAASDGVMLLLAFLIWQARDWRSYGMAGLFLLAAYGRMYVGVHFPLDVLVGLALGIGSMWICHRWSKGWAVERWQQSPWWWRVVGVVVLIEAAVLGLGYKVQPATAQPLALILPVVALALVMRFLKAKSQHDS